MLTRQRPFVIEIIAAIALIVTPYVLPQTSFSHTIVAIIAGTIVAGIIGYLVGLVALRRTGIYFAMITVAIAEVFFFVEFNPLSAFTGGENGLPDRKSTRLNS